MIETINPANGKKLKTYDETSESELQDILSRLNGAYLGWKETSIKERAGFFLKASQILTDKAEVYARLMTDEMGKPLSQAVAEVKKCAWVCDYYAKNTAKFLEPQKVETDFSKSYVAFEPLGVILAVMPWNFPLWQVFRAACPAMMAGNTMVLKHASNVSGSALAIEQVFVEAGFPSNVFRTVLIPAKRVEGVIAHPSIKGVTLTGSVPAGKAVAANAGKYLKKTVLELGGSDGYVILKDADLEKAVESCVTSRLVNGGQSCVAAKRFVVVQDVLEEFQKLYVEHFEKQVMGDPLSEDTTIGPMARADLRDEIHEQVLKSVEQGAKILCGGEIPEGEGAYYPPTVLTNVKKGVLAYGEEIFGPVAAIIPVKDEEEAIRVANDTVFGLGSAVFTRDLVKGEEIAAKKLNAGLSFVNDFVKSDPRLPFGGIMESGYGREMGSFGILEFVNIKSVVVS